MTIPPREPFAAVARRAIEAHTEWDAPHAFVTLHWDGEKLTTHTYGCIMPDIEPPDYPVVMQGLAMEELKKDPGDPAYAYLLQVEGFGVHEPGPEASDAEKLRYKADRLTRNFHNRPDAVESCSVWVADIHGRLWMAMHARKDPAEIMEKFYPPMQFPGGNLVRALLATAYTTGVIAHGLVPPWGDMPSGWEPGHP